MNTYIGFILAAEFAGIALIAGLGGEKDWGKAEGIVRGLVCGACLGIAVITVAIR